MKAKQMQLRLQRRQQAWDAFRSGGGGKIDPQVRARMAAGGFRRPGSPKQSG